MKTISLAEAVQILENCSAVIWDETHHFLIYPDVTDLDGKDDNEFLYIKGEEDGEYYSEKFHEGNNRTVKIEGSSMFLVDPDGEEVQLTILEPAKL